MKLKADHWTKGVRDFCSRRKVWLICIFLVICLIFPLLSSNNYIKSILIRTMIFGVLASALNLMNGYSGMFCLGIAGMMCIGAYVEAILATRFGLSFWLLLPVAGFASAIFGVLVSLPAIRLKGIYFSIITMGFSELVRLLAQNWTSLTGGAMGIKNIPVPTFFGIRLSTLTHYYYIIFGILILCLISIYNLMRSRLGRAWLSIREDETAARSLGVNLLKYKALNFFVAAFWAGVAGAFMAPYYRYIAADMFTAKESFDVLSMLIIGGQGTLVGPLIGSMVSSVLSEGLRPFGDWRFVVYSLLILLTMWLRPQGIAGSTSATLTGLTKKRGKRSARLRTGEQT